MEAAEEFVGNWIFKEFTENRKTQFIVIRALEIIGEATKNIPYEVILQIKRLAEWGKIIFYMQ